MPGLEEGEHLKARGAGIQKYPLILCDQFSRKAPDNPLGLDISLALGAEGVVGGTAKRRPAIYQINLPLGSHGFKVTAHGGFGCGHVHRQVSRRDVPLLKNGCEYLFAPLTERVHCNRSPVPHRIGAGAGQTPVQR